MVDSHSSGNALFKHLASKCDPLAAKAKETKERSDGKKIRSWGGRDERGRPEILKSVKN